MIENDILDIKSWKQDDLDDQIQWFDMEGFYRGRN